jgi:hypothetical protein
MFCAPRPANPYQIDGHSYSAFGAINEGPQSAMRSLSAMSKDPAS